MSNRPHWLSSAQSRRMTQRDKTAQSQMRGQVATTAVLEQIVPWSAQQRPAAHGLIVRWSA
jgi:hypothetical protein